jgi:hypothetical protein
MFKQNNLAMITFLMHEQAILREIVIISWSCIFEVPLGIATMLKLSDTGRQTTKA